MRDAVAAKPVKPSVGQHFVGCSPDVRRIYDLILGASKRFGTVREDPKNTSIHLVNRSAFAGIQTRRDSIVLTLKSADNIDSERIFRRQQASANRWHLEVKLSSAEQVDRELVAWLEAGYKISGQHITDR